MIRHLLSIPVLVVLAIGFPGLSVAQDASPIHHELDVELQPASQLLRVSDRVTLQGRDVFQFRLASWLDLERVLVDGQPMDHSPSAGAWRVPLPDEGEHQIELRFSGTIPPLPLEGDGSSAGEAASGPEGSYLPGYADWVPAGAGWTTYRLRVEVPAPYRAVATGRLEEETLGATSNRAVFVADHPAEAPSLFAGPYTVKEHRQGKIRLRTYFHQELVPLSEDYLRESATYLARFQDRIGAYPFDDFHIISAPLPVGLGFPNLTYIGRRVLPLPFIRARSLGHEVLHNWWGNGVAVDYEKGNWAEGLTTYMADYAFAADKGAAPAREMRLGWLRDYAALPRERDAPVTSFTSKRHAAAQVIGYNKVAFVFHMLKDELGDAVFDEALRRYWRHWRFRIAGWPDIQDAFEEASGRDLGWFFDQWLRQPGAPQLALAAVKAQPDANGHKLVLTVRQKPPVYRLSAPVTIETDAGPEYDRVMLDGPETTVTLTTKARPLAVHLDSDYDIFRRLLPGEAPPILRDVTLAADAMTVIATNDKAAGRSARRLAERMLDTPMRLNSPERVALEATPHLIIGTTPDVVAFLARAGLDGVPKDLADRGTARVWTSRRPGGDPVLVVAADDAGALEALVRPLPHYGRRSYLVFEGRRAVDKGTWRVADSPLSRRLDR